MKYALKVATHAAAYALAVATYVYYGMTAPEVRQHFEEVQVVGVNNAPTPNSRGIVGVAHVLDAAGEELRHPFTEAERGKFVLGSRTTIRTSDTTIRPHRLNMWRFTVLPFAALIVAVVYASAAIRRMVGYQE